MLHIIRTPDWLLKEVLPLYPAWNARNPENTPFHLHGYSCGGAPLTWTGGPYRGWSDLRGSERLLRDDPQMSGDRPRAAIWHPAWRLWELPSRPGWSREMEDIAGSMWSKTGRAVTPTEMGVPSGLTVLCDFNAKEATRHLESNKELSAAA